MGWLPAGERSMIDKRRCPSATPAWASTQTAPSSGPGRAGVAVHCLQVGSPRDLRWLARLGRLLDEGRFDIVHLHSPLIAGMARLLIRGRRRGPRPHLISTEHNVWASYVLPTRLLN